MLFRACMRPAFPFLGAVLLASCVAGPGWCDPATSETNDVGLRLGGTLGFGMSVRKQAARFDWNWDAGREGTTLAELKLEARPTRGVAAFVRFGADLDAFRNEDSPRFALSEASLRWSREIGEDSLGLRLFARQPSALWLDHGLGAPLDPAWMGDDVQGLRAGLADPRGMMVLLAADRRSWFGDRTEDRAHDQIVLLRLRGDPQGSARIRIGATFQRQVPSTIPLPQGTAEGVRQRDLIGFDLRLLVAGVQAQMDYSVVSTQFEGGAIVESEAEPGLRKGWNGGGSRLTDRMPTTAALRAELRAPRLGSPQWGWLGVAPTFRAIGANHTNPAAWTSGAAPTRGTEGFRLEAWYEASAWPLWLRHAYDRQVQFRDASRRIILQESEIEALLARDLRAGLRYVQRQTRDEITHRDDFADDLLSELCASSGVVRLRVQWAAIDLNGFGRRDAFALETGLRMSSRVQLLSRGTWTREGSGLRRAFFVALQYWHLPSFETALQVGPDWIGDAADPALDPDVLGAADQRDLVRLHFRGWF